MRIVLGLTVIVLLPAAIASAICAGMRVLRPASTRRSRVMLAAGVAGLLPVFLPLARMIARGLPYGVIPALSLVVLGLLIALVVGLPVARRATRADFPA